MDFQRALLAVCFIGLAGAENVFQTWADSAFKLVNDDCQNCDLKKSDFYVYAVSPTTTSVKYKTFVADGSGRRTGKHDAVLVLDPAPAKRFGHELYMFFIDGNHTAETCGNTRGTVLLEDGQCLQQWVREMCHRRAPKRRGGCKLLFLPEVRLENSQNDSLVCIPDLEGFNGECPTMIKHRISSGCDPLETNSKFCDTTNYIKTECAFMQTCDHAVLISGGWNRKMSDERSIKNLRTINTLLLRSGFNQNNLRIFFANGLDSSYEEYEDLGDVYPSSIKLAIRYHIRTLCETKRCADSIVIYLNSPSLPDGSLLLWDSNNDGVHDEGEIYSIRDFFRDIVKCSATRLIILVDQSYGGEMVRAAHRHSNDMQNVIIIGVKVNDSRDSMINSLSNMTASTCLSDIYDSVEDVKYKGTAQGLLNGTIYGAPCTNEQDYQKYFGCQNLSTLELIESEETLDADEQR
ncbi:uncharacterized protein LOC106668580 [Cimex lectularius]|uniref:Uncharacterized protein n=1 Tax=Cimex lectularius TaxID=79782 RepID=A0A8I6RWJ0_CIMLE|nr:uncharacterized protein LOC106668580 [Cimex lectularius]